MRPQLGAHVMLIEDAQTLPEQTVLRNFCDGSVRSVHEAVLHWDADDEWRVIWYPGCEREYAGRATY